MKIEKNSTSVIIGLGLFGFGVIYLGKIWTSYSFFQKKGIKTPRYKFFFGNVAEIIEKGHAEALAQWTAKYGKTYGYYEGHLPILVTSDLELVDEIFYKQLSNFTARKRLPQQISDKSSDLNVFSASRNRWKRLRTITNQSFSPSKLKSLFLSLNSSSDRLITELFKNINTDINITELIDRGAMDVVWNCLFGIDVDLINNPDFIYYNKMREFLQSRADFNFSFQLLTYFYELKPLILGFSMLNTLILSKFGDKHGNPFYWLMSRLYGIIEERAKTYSKSKQTDYVQLLIDAKADKINLDFDSQHYEPGVSKLIEKKLTKREILTSLFGFMIAGYDTTSSTINFCMHILLTHSEELAILREEIDSLVELDYDSINRLEYLDMFIKEVLRMYPVANVVQNRRCTKATTLKGIDIPEDLLIAVDVVTLHYDPDNWPGVDPNVFYPLRFASDARYNKLAYMPFGAGARTCVGMKFALLEIKLTVAKILKNFEIYAAKPLETKPSIKDGLFMVRKINEPIIVRLKKRV